MPASGATDAGTGTVMRAVQLLTALADAQGPVTVKQVAERLQLPPSTAHRLLQLLKKEDFVESHEESRQYGIGPAFYRVAARVVSGTSVPVRAQPVVEAIARRFDETVLFGHYLPAEGALAFAARADGEQKLKYLIDMNRPLSLVWGASGKAILAYLPAERARALVAAEGPSPASGATAPSWEQIEPELAAIRARGWAISESEKLPDARGIAAPVFTSAGVVGCLCLTSPKARMPHASADAIGQHIAQHARALSHELGAPLK
jgi:DNA-binding IclR family transcriptional regulator